MALRLIQFFRYDLTSKHLFLSDEQSAEPVLI